MSSPFAALALLREHRQVPAERFGVTSLAWFNSVARHTARLDRNVYVLVVFDASAFVHL